MSQTTDQDKESNMDKKEIADEEREKMLNEENTKHKGSMEPVNTDTEGEEKPKRKIPIGGIKMPGFCRTKSKELGKEEGVKASETNLDVATGAVDAKEENNCTPAATEAKKETPKDSRKSILDAIRLPLVSVFPNKKRNKGDAEMGTAGLASVETLEDGTVDGKVTGGEDGMETVRLDGGDDTEDQIPSKNYPLYVFVEAARRNRLVTGAVLGIFLLVIIIISVACAGPQRIMVMPLKDGKYKEAFTLCGKVEGVLEDGGFAFRGIPYAIPPVNNLRWRSAEPINRIDYCWNGTLLAHNSSEMCVQKDPSSGQIHGSEDCLYLEIFTPQVRYDTPLPVVVMIGAETLSGGSPGVMQPSAKLARVRDMVFVRPNFRMGIFGFLAAEPLSRSTHLPTSGNYGLSDIIAALKWIQLNIHHFGGDRSSVTVWGHRAGGTLITSLLAASKSIHHIGHAGQKNAEKVGLFSRAWISSSSTIFPTRELHNSEKLAEPFLQALGCSDALCLRSKNTKDIMEAVPSNWYSSELALPEPRETPITPENKENKPKHEWLVLDGVILQEDVYQVLQRADSIRGQVIIGTTAHAGTPARFRDPNITMDHSQIEKIVKESLLGHLGVADEAIRRYNATLKGLAGMISDIRVVCPLYNLTSILPRNVSFYVATQSRDGHLADIDSDVAAILGSYTLRTPEAKRHQSAIQQLFNQFVWHDRIIDAASGKAIDNANRRVIVVSQDILPEPGYPNCEFWMKKNIVPNYARLD